MSHLRQRLPAAGSLGLSQRHRQIAAIKEARVTAVGLAAQELFIDQPLQEFGAHRFLKSPQSSGLFPPQSQAGHFEELTSNAVEQLSCEEIHGALPVM